MGREKVLCAGCGKNHFMPPSLGDKGLFFPDREPGWLCAACQNSRPAPEGRCYLAITNHAWGRGETVRKARVQVRREGGSGVCVVVEAPAGAWVGWNGSPEWETDEGKPDQKCVEVARTTI